MTALTKKRCSKCGVVKSIDQFHKDNSRNGTQRYCKKCSVNLRAVQDKSNPVQKQTCRMLNGARSRAKQKNILFNLDLDFLRSIVVSHCPILGVELAWSTNRLNGNRALPNSPSLDRIDPARGYVKDNVWIISHKANCIKSNATHEELKLVTEAVGRAIVNSLDW